MPEGFSNSTRVSSAGFVGPGRTSPQHALQVAQSYGIDLSSHRSEVITSENLRAADLIVVMSREQQKGISARVGSRVPVIVLGDLDPLPISRRTIVDPWEGDAALFEQSYDRVDRCVRELARIIFGSIPGRVTVQPRQRLAAESADGTGEKSAR